MQATAIALWMRRAVRASLWLGVAFATYLICSISFMGFYEKWQLREANHEYNIALVMDGTVIRPVAYRRLLPDVAAFIDQRMPEGFKQRLYAETSSPDFDFREQVPLDVSGQPEYATRYYLIFMAVFAAVFAAFAAFFVLGKAIGVSAPSAYVAAAAALLAIPVIETKGGYYYDYPEFFFLCVFLVLAMARDRRLYWLMLPVAMLATWNKESFIAFIPCAYPFLRERIGDRRAMAMLAACMALAAGVYAVVRARVAHIPDPRGSPLELLRDHFDWFTTPARFLEHDMTYGMLMPPGIALLMAVAIGGAIAASWPGLSTAARQSILLATAINVPLYFLFCATGELRNLSMLIPAMVMALAVLTERMFRPDQAASGAAERG